MRHLGTLLLTCALVWLAPVTAAEAATPKCKGERATIVGTDKGEYIYGTRGRDVIAALDGRDIVYGMGGNDVICGGRGNDVLYGGPGADRLHGGPDLVRTVYGQVRHRGDGLVGGSGDDLLDPGIDRSVPDELDVDSPDFVYWAGSKHGVRVDAASGVVTGQGRDRVRPFTGVWTLTEHDDVFVGSDGPDEVNALGGDDDINTGQGDDVVRAGHSNQAGAYDGNGDNDVVNTGVGSDVVHSSRGTDVVDAGAGDDDVSDYGCFFDGRIDLGPGSDVAARRLGNCDGSPESGVAEVLAGPEADLGTDVIRLFVHGGTAHDWDMSTGEFRRDGVLVARLTGFHVASLAGTGMLRLAGTDAADEVSGSMTLNFQGRGGDDRFTGGEGDDHFDGGTGDDTYVDDDAGGNTCTSVEHDPEAVCAGP